MKPILFPATSTLWTSNGLGALSDAISCVVYEERNGEYELTMTYPVGGIHFDEIHDRAIIYAIPSPYREPQPFRIYCIDSPLNGIVTIHAHHLSYDLSGIPVEPFEAGTCAMALLGLTAHSIVTNPFSVNTDKSVTAPFKLKVPTSFRACLGGQEGSILDVYGKGEYEFDKYDVNLWVNRGSDNGVKIAYGKNITDFNMEKNLESVTTGVYPFWSDLENDELVEIPGRIIKIYDPTNPTYLLESGGAYLTEAEDKYLTVQTPFNFNNILPLDLSSEFDEKPTPEELRARAEKYIKDNSLGTPRISIDVSFIDLGQTEEYKDLAGLEACDLCDTVTVEFPMYGISVKAEIVRIETDVLLERYNSVEIGDARTSIADTIAKLAVNSASKREVTVSTQKAADYINNTVGIFEWIDNGDGTNGGFTIYETDESSSWLRCTAGGIGISNDGGLTYTNAITKNGVVASKLDVEENGNPLLKIYFDDDDGQTQMDAYHPYLNAKMFSLESGQYGGVDSRWITSMKFINPITNIETMVLQSNKPNTLTDNGMNTMLRMIAPTITDIGERTHNMVQIGSAGKIGADSTGNAVNSYIQLEGKTTSNGYSQLEFHTNLYDVNTSSMVDSPCIYVNDPTQNYHGKILKLRKITINSTDYYIFAST